MASERRTTHLSPDVDRRFREFHEDRDLSESKAIERAVDRGLAQMGYDDAERDRTRVERGAYELAKAFLIAAFTVGVLSLTTAVAFAEFIAPLLLLAAASLLVVYFEPGLSRRLGGGA